MLEDGADGGIVDFQDFLGRVRVRTSDVYVCSRCAATYRIASTTHFATGAISRSRRPPYH